MHELLHTLGKCITCLLMHLPKPFEPENSKLGILQGTDDECSLKIQHETVK